MKGSGSIGCCQAFKVFRVYRGYSTCQVTLALNAIAYNHNLIKHLCIFFQTKVDYATAIDLNSLRFVAYKRNGKGSITVTYLNRVITIEIGNTTVAGSFFKNSHTGHWLRIIG